MLASMGQGASSRNRGRLRAGRTSYRVPDPVAVLRASEQLRRKRTRVKGLRRLGTTRANRRNRLALAARSPLGLRLAPTCVLTRQTVRPMWFDMAWTAGSNPQLRRPLSPQERWYWIAKSGLAAQRHCAGASSSKNLA